MRIMNQNRLTCISIVACLAIFNMQDCGNKSHPSSNSQNKPPATPTAGPSVSALKPDEFTDNGGMIYGVTIDDAGEYERIVPSINRLTTETHRKITTRIVIDPGQKLSRDYIDSVKAIKAAGDVMALVGDSHDMHKFGSVKAYRKRIADCYEKLGAWVDIWEIGNEVNGIWAGWKEDKKKDDEHQPWNTAEDNKLRKKRKLIADQTMGAYEEILKLDKNAKVALTLYYNGEKPGDECWDRPEYGMASWVNEYLKDAGFRDRLNYVFISFYSDDCPILSEGKPEDNVPRWITVFKDLSTTFGSAGVGFGEFGPQCRYKEPLCYDESKEEPYTRMCDKCTNDQEKFINAYYGVYHNGIIKAQVLRYVGGYFYWYFLQDMTPSNRHAVDLLRDTIKAP